MVSVLATGGLGFIGSHTCVELLEKGYKVIIVDSLFNSSEDVLKQIKNVLIFRHNNFKINLKFKKGDVRNEIFLREIFKEAISDNNPIEAVLHFAGLKSVSESIVNPIDYWSFNLVGTITLLNVMNEYGCRRIVFSSSATIYKPSKNKFINESSDLEPINPYGNTKLTIENFLFDISKSNPNKWKIVNLRYFNPVGADSSGFLGENFNDKPSNLFPILMKVASKELPSLPIFGKDWDTHDGTCIRDYIHITDLSLAHVEALNFIFENKSNFSSINIGTGKGFSVLEVIEKFKKVNCCDIPYYFADKRKGDSPNVVADNTLALSLLKWTPLRNLEDMCKDSWYWRVKNLA